MVFFSLTTTSKGAEPRLESGLAWRGGGAWRAGVGWRDKTRASGPAGHAATAPRPAPGHVLPHAAGRRQRKAARACGWPVQFKAQRPCSAPARHGSAGGLATVSLVASLAAGEGWAGVEPATHVLSARCSIQLSYQWRHARSRTGDETSASTPMPCQTLAPRGIPDAQHPFRSHRPTGRPPAPAGRAFGPNPGLRATGTHV